MWPKRMKKSDVRDVDRFSLLNLHFPSVLNQSCDIARKDKCSCPFAVREASIVTRRKMPHGGGVTHQANRCSQDAPWSQQGEQLAQGIFEEDC